MNDFLGRRNVDQTMRISNVRIVADVEFGTMLDSEVGEFSATLDSASMDIKLEYVEDIDPWGSTAIFPSAWLDKVVISLEGEAVNLGNQGYYRIKTAEFLKKERGCQD